MRLGDGRVLNATKIGKINTIFKVYDNDNEITMYNVFYVKDMKQNLISFSKVTNKNKVISVGNYAKIYNKYKNLVAIAKKEQNLYHMTSYVMDKRNLDISANVVKGNSMSLREKWHRTLGHVNFQYLEQLCKNELVTGLPKRIESEKMKCVICIESKMTNKPFENDRRKLKEILEIVHTDLNGPHPIAGNNGEKYFVSFIDDYSKLVKVYCIKNKSETLNCFIDFVNLAENLTGK